MVRWDWKCKCGEIIPKSKSNTKLNMYAGTNCMVVIVQEWEENGKYIYCDAWHDIKTLKELIKDDKLYILNFNVKKIKINTAFLPDEWYKIAKVLTQQGIKVELYYKR